MRRLRHLPCSREANREARSGLDPVSEYMRDLRLDKQSATDEVVADYAMRVLFSDMKTAREVTKHHSKVAEAIRRAFAWIREKLGIRTSEVDRAAAMWNKAYNESRRNASGAVDLAERMAGYHADRIAEAGEAKVDYSIAYQNAETNNDIIALIERIRNGQFKVNERVELGTVSSDLAERIKAITGIDTSDYKVVIEARMLDHIIKDHGANGKANHSLKSDADIAKMQYALTDPDAMSYGGRTQAYTFMRDGRNRTAPTVLYEKEIGTNSYYVVEAVPETKARTLYIVSAFIGKKGYKNKAVQLTDTNSPSATPKNGSATASKNSIPNSAENVNTLLKYDSDVNNSISSTDDTYINFERRLNAVRGRQTSVSEVLRRNEKEARDVKREFLPDMKTVGEVARSFAELGLAADATTDGLVKATTDAAVAMRAAYLERRIANEATKDAKSRAAAKKLLEAAEMGEAYATEQHLRFSMKKK